MNDNCKEGDERRSPGSGSRWGWGRRAGVMGQEGESGPGAEPGALVKDVFMPVR